MSALGDYIHLNTSNYLKYGVAKDHSAKGLPGVGAVYAQQKQVNQQRIKALPKVQDKALTELRRRIGINFGPEKQNATMLIAQKGEEKLLNDINTKLLSQIDGNPFATRVGGGLKNLNQKTNLEAAMAARRKLLDRIKYFNETKSEKTAQTIINHLNEFFQDLGFIIEDEEWLITRKEILAGNKNITDALKEIVMADCFSSAHKATVHGQMGEKIVAMCNDTIYYNACSNANDIIKKSIIGGEGTSFALDESFISKGVAQAYQERYKQNLYQVRKTQDKVDVQLTIEGEELNASVKAYTPKSGYIKPHLQDVQLLTSLASTVPHFANHWLNIHCATAKLPSKGLDAVLDDHIRYEALVKGNLLKKGSLGADTFITIDVTSGKVYAVSTRDILEKKAPGTNFILNPMTSSIYIGGNRMKSTAEERIADIISNIRKVQISASLSISLAALK